MDTDLIIDSKLNKKVIITKKRLELITKIKHPIMHGKEENIIDALRNPDEIRQSISDNSVLLYYKKIEKYSICAVVSINNNQGFIITAYITDRIKEGKIIYLR
ncbi:DUF4258 domain-containing protein [Candidatus Woesearchaeota archaeon]|nr:DUF4258 domain-containing protein [Candidatus Woesearchaeota archaeon]